MAVQSVAKPSDAPACVYVPIPDGSSSEAPVINPGPRIIRTRLMGFFSRASLDSSVDSRCRLAGVSPSSIGRELIFLASILAVLEFYHASSVFNGIGVGLGTAKTHARNLCL